MCKEGSARAHATRDWAKQASWILVEQWCSESWWPGRSVKLNLSCCCTVWDDHLTTGLNTGTLGVLWVDFKAHTASQDEDYETAWTARDWRPQANESMVELTPHVLPPAAFHIFESTSSEKARKHFDVTVTGLHSLFPLFLFPKASFS